MQLEPNIRRVRDGFTDGPIFFFFAQARIALMVPDRTDGVDDAEWRHDEDRGYHSVRRPTGLPVQQY